MDIKSKILIIEDNTEMRENISEILDLAGYETHSAADGLIGIQAARQHKPDLILCDIMMPNLDGFGVIKIMQQDENLKSIPLIFLTAKAEREDFRKGMNLGAEDYLLKPFEDSDLLEVIEKKLKKYKELSVNKTARILSGLIQFKEFEKLDSVQDLLKNTSSKELVKKTKIWHSQDNVNHVYYLESGHIKEVIDAVGGKEFILEFYSAPGFAGLNYLFQANYPGYAELLETSSVKILSRKTLEEIILKDNLLTSFLHYTNDITGDRIQRLTINSFGNVREKVAFHICHLSGKINFLTIQLSREDLASYCGIAKETLIRTLTEFKDEKLIKLDQDGLVILQPQKLLSLFA
jgi:CheY-like chemotaxis protein